MIPRLKATYKNEIVKNYYQCDSRTLNKLLEAHLMRKPTSSSTLAYLDAVASLIGSTALRKLMIFPKRSPIRFE